ncbi:MAG: heparinase II/III family protein, partial [Phycisphaerae bacterium]|nr:heparinase II/III family protein [Phycisphaerae bacterium]
MNDYIFPAGGGKWKGASKENPGDITWKIAKSGSVRSNDVLRDWTPYNCLVFTIKSNRIVGSQTTIRITIGSKDKGEYFDYVRIDFKGTKDIVIPFDEFGWSKATMGLQLGSLDKSGLGAETKPRLGLQDIDYIKFHIHRMWSPRDRKSTVLNIRNLRLAKISISKVGPRTTDRQLFTEMLDLDYPGLEKVKSAVKKGDFKAARHELAEHIRRRKKPVWFAPNERATTEDARFRGKYGKRIRRVGPIMAHKFNVRYHRHVHDFGKRINWCVHPLAKGPTGTIEWNSMLNRHFHFFCLVHAYRKTGDEKYARELAQQMNSFIEDCPVLLNGSGNPHERVYHGPWETLNTAMRYQNSWPDVIFDCFGSPEFTDDIIVNIVKSSAEHARHLVKNHMVANWLTAESLAVFTIGNIFPEFKEAAAWRRFGITKLYNQLEGYVYPDGMMYELALGYNCWVLEQYVRILMIAKMNGRMDEIPADYKNRIEKMFNYVMYNCMPNGQAVGLNDSYNMCVKELLGKGYRLFPKRSDFLYPISTGKQGTRPKQDSIAMPYSGHYIMRSGWDKNARMLHFDGGLLGSSHCHEDKLHVTMYAHGKLLLPDASSYNYNRSKWRAYVVKTRSHNTVLVDGMDQARGSGGGRFRVWPKPWKTPSPATDTRWTTTHGLDYVVGFYRHKYREYTDWQHRKKHPKTLDTVQHARKILFVKPDFWIIHDVLTSKDDKKHTCDVLFHINADEAKIDPETNAVTSVCKGAANV